MFKSNYMNKNCLEETFGYDEEDLRQDHTKRSVQYFLQNKPFSKNQRMSLDPFIICLYLLIVFYVNSSVELFSRKHPLGSEIFYSINDRFLI